MALICITAIAATAATAATPPPPRLPALNLDPTRVSVGGISSGADFALFWIGKLIDGDHAALMVVVFLCTGCVFTLIVVCMCLCCTSEQNAGARPYPGFLIKNPSKKKTKSSKRD